MGSRFGTSWAVQPRSMFIEALNAGILEAMQTGLLQYWKRRTLFDIKVDTFEAKKQYG